MALAPRTAGAPIAGATAVEALVLALEESPRSAASPKRSVILETPRLRPWRTVQRERTVTPIRSVAARSGASLEKCFIVMDTLLAPKEKLRSRPVQMVLLARRAACAAIRFSVTPSRAIRNRSPIASTLGPPPPPVLSSISRVPSTPRCLATTAVAVVSSLKPDADPPYCNEGRIERRAQLTCTDGSWRARPLSEAGTRRGY